MIELYAIADHPGPPLPAPLRAVPVDGLAAVCATAVDEELTAETLWRHEELVESLMEQRDVLPVRYGTRLRDDEAVVQAVRERQDELAAALDRARGAVELSLRVLAPDGGEPAQGLHAPLAGLARENVRRLPRDPAEVLRAAYLVDRRDVGRFTELVSRLQDENPGLRLLCTGPWPPYSFAE